MNDAVCRAIDGRCLVDVDYKGEGRIIEPYILFESADGAILIHGWQVEGAYVHTPPPDWCNLKMRHIGRLTILSRKFHQPQPGYNPHSRQFHRIIRRV